MKCPVSGTHPNKDSDTHSKRIIESNPAEKTRFKVLVVTFIPFLVSHLSLYSSLLSPPPINLHPSSPARLPSPLCSGCCKGFTLLIFPKQTRRWLKAARRGAEHERGTPRGPAGEVITLPATPPERGPTGGYNTDLYQNTLHYPKTAPHY